MSAKTTVLPEEEPVVFGPENKSEEEREPAVKQKKPRAKKSPGASKTKRGPARPYRKLGTEVLNTRIQKLSKRIEKSRSQLTDAETFLAKYTREQEFRDKDGVAVA